LKPAHEPIVVARKPIGGTVAANVLEWGTGGLNVDGCRVGYASNDDMQAAQALADLRAKGRRLGVLGEPGQGLSLAVAKSGDTRSGNEKVEQHPAGRFPANVIHDGSDEVTRLFPVTTSGGGQPIFNKANKKGKNAHAGYVRPNASMFTDDQEGGLRSFGDTGSAARFFYCAKASKADRDEGLDGLELQRTTFAAGTGLRNNGDGTPRNNEPSNRNHHPTVKPTALMRYLCRLVTPPGGVVLDPFTGSGSTGKGAVIEGFDFIGIEREAEYIEIAERRIQAAKLPLFVESE
jgi:site-specific DNA-methyltransferase (adenine-specific)